MNIQVETKQLNTFVIYNITFIVYYLLKVRLTLLKCYFIKYIVMKLIYNFDRNIV